MGEEISKAVKYLKTSKAAGFDKILNEFLISGKESLLHPIYKILNRIFTSRTYLQCDQLSFLDLNTRRMTEKTPTTIKV